MRTVLTAFGALLALSGAVWFVQGINILPGSFMTGQSRWAIIGGVTFVAGIIFLALARRAHRKNGRGQ